MWCTDSVTTNRVPWEALANLKPPTASEEGTELAQAKYGILCNTRISKRLCALYPVVDSVRIQLQPEMLSLCRWRKQREGAGETLSLGKSVITALSSAIVRVVQFERSNLRPFGFGILNNEKRRRVRTV